MCFLCSIVSNPLGGLFIMRGHLELGGWDPMSTIIVFKGWVMRWKCEIDFSRDTDNTWRSSLLVASVHSLKLLLLEWERFWSCSSEFKIFQHFFKKGKKSCKNLIIDSKMALVEYYVFITILIAFELNHLNAFGYDWNQIDCGWSFQINVLEIWNMFHVERSLFNEFYHIAFSEQIHRNPW